MITAIVAAAGAGKRMGANRNKILLPLDGVAVILRAVRQVMSCNQVDRLVVVTAESEMDVMRKMLVGGALKVPWTLVRGGPERQDSVKNGFDAINNDDESASDEIVLVHDAARPLVDAETVRELVTVVRHCGAAIVAVPIADTIKRVEEFGTIVETVPRQNLWLAQTPQGFRRDILARAYAQAEQDGFVGTDEASLVERLGVPVHVVKGSLANFKLTTLEDMMLAEAYLRRLDS